MARWRTPDVYANRHPLLPTGGCTAMALLVAHVTGCGRPFLHQQHTTPHHSTPHHTTLPCPAGPAAATAIAAGATAAAAAAPATATAAAAAATAMTAAATATMATSRAAARSPPSRPPQQSPSRRPSWEAVSLLARGGGFACKQRVDVYKQRRLCPCAPPFATIIQPCRRHWQLDMGHWKQ